MSEWHLASAQSQGRGHTSLNIPCQDKTRFLTVAEVSVIALADGAGSARLSHHGAETVTDAICDFLSDNFDRLYKLDEDAAKTEILADLLNALSIKSSELSCEPPQLASTLLSVAVKKGRYISVHIGDGVIGALGNTTIETISKPDNGELANETAFVTSADAEKRLRLYRGQAKKYSGFILLSDGSGNSLYDKRKQTLTKAIAKLFYACKSENSETMCRLLSELLDEQLTKRTDDDCSIAIMSRNRRKLDKLCKQL